MMFAVSDKFNPNGVFMLNEYSLYSIKTIFH